MANIQPEAEQLRTLIRKRKAYCEKLETLTKRKSYLQGNSHKQEQSAQPQAEVPEKMVKLESGVKQEDPTPKKSERVKSSTQLPKQNEQPEAVRKLREEQLRRNRRLFGGLNLHLDRAKTKIEQEKPKLEQKIKIIEKVQEKEKEKSERILRQQIQKLSSQISQLQKLKDQNARQILKMQNQILLNSYTAYASTIKNFTFTKTEPSISWKPTKDIQMMAKKLLNEKEQQTEQRHNKIIEQIKNYQEMFDMTTYIIENEREYYKHYLANYYRELNSFYKTETEPVLLWTLGKPNPELNPTGSEAFQQRIQQMIAENSRNSEEFYRERLANLRQKRQNRMEQHEQQQEQQESSDDSPPLKQQYK